MNLKLKEFLRKKLNFIKAVYHSNNLTELAKIYRADKWGRHFYTIHYGSHFRKFRYKKIKLLEIGVGGDENPKGGGSSLRMWKKFFPFGKIFSLDIYDKSYHEERRIKIFMGSQADKPFLEKVMSEIGNPDLIIDDGSHVNGHVIETFKLLFPYLKEGGIYVVEDMLTSYYEHFGGDSKDLNNPVTMMNFFKKQVDGLNFSEFQQYGYQPTYFDQHIISMHFYHNMVFVYKGTHDEPSGVVENYISSDPFR